MKIRDKMITLLEVKGLTRSDAEAVVKDYEQSVASDPTSVQLDDAEGEHHSMVISGVWLSVRSIAIDWIGLNRPRHFALGLLVNESC